MRYNRVFFIKRSENRKGLTDYQRAGTALAREVAIINPQVKSDFADQFPRVKNAAVYLSKAAGFSY